MADHGHHDPGGHELEAINTKLLFRLLISLSLVTLLSAIAVVQWFNAQRRELDHRNAASGSFQLKTHDAEMAKRLEGIDQVAANLATNPAMLKAPEAPAGWINPDDLVGAGAAAAPAKPVEAPKPPEPEPAPIPVEAPDDGAQPADGAVPADGGKPADGAQPAEPKGDQADKPKDNQGKDDAVKADKAEKADDKQG